MKVKVAVGDVSVQIYGATLSVRQIRAILMDCAGVAATLTPEAEAEPERAPLGFGIVTELAKPDEPDLSEYFEDES